MSQTAYAINIPEGAAGVMADTGDSATDSLDNPNDEIQWGRGLVYDSTSDRSVKLPDASDNIFRGIARRDTSIQGSSYPAKTTVGSCKRGVIWVPIEQDVTPADPVYMRYLGRKQIQTIVFSGDLITANSVSIDVDGVTLTQAFDTNNSTTLAALAVQIAAEAGVSTAVSDGSHTITVTAAVMGVDVVLDNEGVTGGVSQATIAITETVSGILDADRGLFRMSADTSTAILLTRCRWMNSGSAGGTAKLEVNLP